MKVLLTSLSLLLPLAGFGQCFQFSPNPDNPWGFDSSHGALKEWIKQKYPYLKPAPSQEYQKGLAETAKKVTVEQERYFLPNGGTVNFLFKTGKLKQIQVTRKSLSGDTPWVAFTPCGTQVQPGIWVDMVSRARVLWTPTRLTYYVTEERR